MQAPANGATHNRWREIVPDLVISNDGVSRTYDLKIISYGAQYRPAAEVAAPRQAGAVNTRADKVAGEYLRAAQKLDRDAVGVAVGWWGRSSPPCARTAVWLGWQWGRTTSVKNQWTLSF